MDNDTLIMTMLFDFFGDLLSDKQREYFDLYYNDDLSLSEIAERNGISRQGVYDTISRAEKSLTEMEEKTGVIKRWLKMRSEIDQAMLHADHLMRLCGVESDAAQIIRELVLILDNLKQ